MAIDEDSFELMLSTDRGVQIHGGSGYINETKVERIYRDVRLLRLYEGTTQIQQIIIGRALMRD